MLVYNGHNYDVSQVPLIVFMLILLFKLMLLLGVRYYGLDFVMACI